MKREIATEDKNLKLYAHDEVSSGGGCSKYSVEWNVNSDGVAEGYIDVNFQHGPVKEVGINGVSNEILLEMVIDRLKGFQAGTFKSILNSAALSSIQEGLAILYSRTKDREARGVEGKNIA